MIKRDIAAAIPIMSIPNDDLDRLTDADYLVDGGRPDREDSFVMDGR